MNNNGIFIPAPAGHHLAVWHFDNGEALYPLLGWVMVPDVGVPVFLDGALARRLGPDEATCVQVVNPDAVPAFRMDAWVENAEASFAVAVSNYTAAHEASMATNGHAEVSNNHASYEAAARLVSAGRARWVDGYGRITPC